MAKFFSLLTDKKLADILKNGDVGVLPTDTVYGLVCVAQNRGAVERLYTLKARHNKPGTIIAADINQLVELGIKYRYLKAVEQYWPGAVSIVLPFINPDKTYLRQGLMTQPVRLPEGKEINQLLKQTGPLLTSSANLASKPPANNIEEAQKYFGDEVNFYVDGGNLSDRKPSTIIRVIDDAVEVLREGAVKINTNE